MKYIKNYTRVIVLAFRAEFNTMMKNKGALLVLVGAVIIYPLIYSIAYSPELLRELPIAIVDQDQTSTSRTLISMIDATEQIDLSFRASSMSDAEKAFDNNQVYGIIVIPSKFEADILNTKQTTISSYCDASYMLMYKQTITGVLQSSLTFSAGVEIKRLLVSGSSMNMAKKQIQPFKNNVNVLYNPSGAYGTFVMPALILFIIQQTLIIGIGMMGGYQRERGRHLHTIRGFCKYPSAIILGKSLAYALISLLNAIFALGFLHYGFNFPSKAEFLHLLMLCIPFIFATIFMGVMISGIFRKAEHSIMMMVFLSLIIIFLSGFSWPVHTLPVPLQYIRMLFPANVVISPYLRLREMGVSLIDIRTELFTIIGQMIIYFSLTVMVFKAKKRKY